MASATFLFPVDATKKNGIAGGTAALMVTAPAVGGVKSTVNVRVVVIALPLVMVTSYVSPSANACANETAPATMGCATGVPPAGTMRVSVTDSVKQLEVAVTDELFVVKFFQNVEPLVYTLVKFKSQLVDETLN
jgi:hypothetical protein